MAMRSGIGARIETGLLGLATHAALFGEDQGRYLIAVPPADVDGIAKAAVAAGVTVLTIGTTGGDALTLGDDAPILLSALREAHERFLPAFMEGSL